MRTTLVPAPRHPDQCRSPSIACQWRIGWFAPSVSASLGVAPPTIRRQFVYQSASSPDPRCGCTVSMSYTAAVNVILQCRPVGEVIHCSIRGPAPRHYNCAKQHPDRAAQNRASNSVPSEASLTTCPRPLRSWIQILCRRVYQPGRGLSGLPEPTENRVSPGSYQVHGRSAHVHHQPAWVPGGREGQEPTCGTS
jgi:hypothetical protein